MPVYDWWVYIVFAIPGLFLFFMNWGIFIHNARGGKWISGVPRGYQRAKRKNEDII